MCTWCRPVEIDDEWFLAPRQALSAIQARYTLSHSICEQVDEAAARAKREREYAREPSRWQGGRWRWRTSCAPDLRADLIAEAFLSEQALV